MRPNLSPSKLVSCIALAVLVAACGDDLPPETDASSSPEETIAPVEGEPQETEVSTDTSAVPETALPETTVPDAPVATDAAAVTVAPEPAPQPEPETTPAPAPTSRADLVPRSNGVGSADFGQVDIDVIPVVNAVLGDPVDDRLGEYPTFDDDVNLYVDFEDTAFSSPFGRTTCYDNEFCLYFGGNTGDDLRFVGWSQGGFEPTSDPLVTAGGVTIGSRYADHLGVMTVDEGGCFTNGYGEVAGIVLLVTSETVPFGSFDEAGDYVSQTPDPADIFVNSMKAGDEPFFLFADC